MSDAQSADEVYQWGQPKDARRWHIFDGARSLCMNWMYGSATQNVDPENDSCRDGEDCKTCCRKAGVLDE